MTVPDPGNSTDPIEVAIAGVSGDSTRDGYAGDVEADALGFGVGVTADGTEFENVRLSMPLAKEAPVVFANAAAGKLLSSVAIYEISPNGSYVPLTLQLTDATVVDQQVVGLREVLELQYKQIGVTTVEQNESGQTSVPSTVDFDVANGGGVRPAGASLPELSVGDVPQSSNFNAYVQADGVSGESTDAVYQNQIVVTNAAFGLQSSPGGGAAFDTLQLTGPLANHSTSLLSDVATGTHLASLTLSVVSATSDSRLIYRVQLTNVVVDSYETADTTETWSVQYGKIELTVLPYDDAGKQGTPIIGGVSLSAADVSAGRALSGETTVPDPNNSADPIEVAIAGVDGDSTRDGYADDVEADALGFGIGTTADGTELENVRLSLPLAEEAPVVFVDAAVGKVLSSVAINELSPDGSYVPLTVQLVNATVVDQQIVGLREVLELQYSKITVETVDENASGETTAPSEFGFDAVAGEGGVVEPGASLPELSVGDVPQSSNFNAYVQADGVDGESTDAVYKNQIVVTNAAFGLQSSSSGATTFDTLQLTGPLADHSTTLLKDVAAGTRLSGLTLSVVSTSAGSPLIYTVQLTNVVVDSYETADTTETWNVQYGKIQFTVLPYDDAGKQGTPIIGGVSLSAADVSGGRALPGETTVPDPNNSADPIEVAIAGVDGDSTRDAYVDDVEADALGFGIGTTAEGTEFENVRLSLPLAQEGPPLFQDAATGELIASVAISELSTNPDSSVVPLKLDLTKVKVVDQQIVGLREVLELQYDTITVEANADPAAGIITGTITEGVAGQTVFLDANGDGELDADELTTTTRSDGTYEFDDVPSGSYVIEQVLPAGYTQTAPANGVGLAVTVSDGGDFSDEDFVDAPATTLLVTAPGDQSATAGVSQSFAAGSFSAANATAPFTVTIDWGDGTPDTMFSQNAPGSIPAQVHIFAVGGTDTVSISVYDAAGHPSNTATFTATVAPAVTGGSVSGTVTAGVAGVAGEVIYLDANNSGTLDSGELSTTTAADGSYQFSSVPAGAYIVTQILPARTIQVSPGNGRGILISVTDGGTLSAENFVDTTVVNGTVSGAVTGAPTGGGETIYLDANNNSRLDPSELSTTTGTDGTYVFSDVPAGNYVVRQLLSGNYSQVSPGNGYGNHVSVTAGAAVTGQNFVDAAPNSSAVLTGTITGGEQGETVYLDANNNAQLDSGERSTLSDTNGFYSFSGVTAGAYIVRQILPADRAQETPTRNFGLHVLLTSGEILSGQNFTDATISPGLKLIGTVIGTAGSYQNLGNTIANAVDGNLGTFFDAAQSSGAYVGLDLGSATVATQVRFAPRSGYESRMLGGVFQASNTGDFSAGVVTLQTITAAPAAGSLTTLSLNNTTAYRYYRYLSPDHSHGNIAELEFDA